MARYITRPGPPPRKNGSEVNEDGHVETDSKPNDFPEEVEFEEESDEELEQTEVDLGVGLGEEETEEEDVCMDWWTYAKPIEVYLCLQEPERLAWDIFLWERLEHIGIDQCVDVHADAPCQPETNIPPEAMYVVVGDTVMQNPYGHTALFCKKVKDRRTGYEKYTPVVGFFWSFINSNSTTVQSLSEYFHARAAPSQLVSIYERIPYQDEIRFPGMFNMMKRTVNKEIHLLETNGRCLRNVMGTNRAKPTRWRSIIQKQGLIQETAPPEEKVAPKSVAPKKRKEKKTVPPAAIKTAPKKRSKS